MKKLVLAFSTLLFTLVGFAQKTYKITSVNQDVRTTDFYNAIQKVNAFVAQNQITIEGLQQTNSDYTLDITIVPSLYPAYTEMANTLGIFISNNLTTQDRTPRVNQLKSDIEYTNERIDLQKANLAKMDQTTDVYRTAWNELKNYEANLRNYQTELASITAYENYYDIHLSIEDETYTPQTSSVTWVNMPGFEYSYLKIEEPQDTLTSPYYQGYMLKYVFTKGKSFINLGAYKTTTPASPDTLHYSEFFVFGFGQDFYSRHLGRGVNKFFNLYSSYTIGGMLASNDKRKETYAYIAPGIGVEIFKNKYVLIDSKVNYLVPFRDTRHTRGLSFNLAFNFVF